MKVGIIDAMGTSVQKTESQTPAGATSTATGELSPVVTGILLLMLEDDSMAVRLAGIRAMSCFGRAC